VSVGPRGSYALENLVKELNQSGNIEVLLFEITPHIGNGPVYNVNQAESNWININERILRLTT
jgi:uncharacterized NAD(P)/FAD-binding protein YdhS